MYVICALRHIRNLVCICMKCECARYARMRFVWYECIRLLVGLIAWHMHACMHTYTKTYPSVQLIWGPDSFWMRLVAGGCAPPPSLLQQQIQTRIFDCIIGICMYVCHFILSLTQIQLKPYTHMKVPELLVVDIAISILVRAVNHSFNLMYVCMSFNLISTWTEYFRFNLSAITTKYCVFIRSLSKKNYQRCLFVCVLRTRIHLGKATWETFKRVSYVYTHMETHEKKVLWLFIIFLITFLKPCVPSQMPWYALIFTHGAHMATPSFFAPYSDLSFGQSLWCVYVFHVCMPCTCVCICMHGCGCMFLYRCVTEA
jgi:hypothetical protein